MPWHFATIATGVGVVAWLYTLGSASAWAESRETGCADNENLADVCDEHKVVKVLVMLATKLPIVTKVVYYPVYAIDPKRRAVKVDGVWGTVKPCCTRMTMATAVAVSGMLSVPFAYLIRLPMGIALIGLLTTGLVVVVAMTSFVDLCRGAISIGAAIGRWYAAGVGASILGSILAYTSATGNDYWADPSKVAMVINGDLAGALVLEAAAQAIPFITTACFWRRGAVIHHPDPDPEEDDWGAGDDFIFDDVRDAMRTQPHLAALAAGLDGAVPRNSDLRTIAIPGDHRSTSSEDSWSTDDGGGNGDGGDYRNGHQNGDQSDGDHVHGDGSDRSDLARPGKVNTTASAHPQAVEGSG